MERYKLIMEYPGSPKKGAIVYSPHREKAYHDEPFKLKNDSRNDINFIFFEEK